MGVAVSRNDVTFGKCFAAAEEEDGKYPSTLEKFFHIIRGFVS